MASLKAHHHPNVDVVTSKIEFQGRALLQWKATLETQELHNTWISKTSPCNWTGITCRNDGHLMPNITKLQLRDFGLEGKLETLNFSDLPSLKVLDLNGNRLYEFIPATISVLSKLIILDLANNSLTGIIPLELGNLTRLKTLWLATNQISGSIPLSFGNLLNLNRLAISINSLVGSISLEFGNLTKLNILYLWSNNFTGSIPPEIGYMVNLKEFDISSNNITGSIPPNIGNLTKLETFKLDINNINGFIPFEIGNLVNFKIFDISYNQITGPIPYSTKNLTKLERFYLHDNNINGSIREIGNLVNLGNFDVSNNQIIDSIPPSIGNLTNLELLYLYGNNISGFIPSEIGNLINLTVLQIFDNQLSGPIPHGIGRDMLDISSNNLVGKIPRELGAIPPEFGDLSSLEVLDLSRNNLIGEIPIWLKNCIKLSTLKLSNNLLNGTIPSQIENTRLKDLMAKMDTLLQVMDQRDKRIKVLEQSLMAISQYIENQQAHSSVMVVQPPSRSTAEGSHASESRAIQPSLARSLRLDFPRFDSSDALQWIFIAEQFFDFYDISDPYHLKIVAVHMKGKSSHGFKCCRKLVSFFLGLPWLGPLRLHMVRRSLNARAMRYSSYNNMIQLQVIIRHSLP
ncbi:probable leucine-rich repeat receptor-like protein kinase At1g35710 [Dioscorea cayenensis subsp. rotundata]|uniref:Probable leucine-rich repeat receptor-like protein kinase At1g35710 n=1 Tax=Dioscorea cayennensis subsp. rotundata TaxID=55577 RepID=A0AB40AZ87_DIOCR|nr:probable leucine-rich repeat receptor-like protein kinase At1g35710 [Dioscorea cayenensis subsp. rotundata]